MNSSNSYEFLELVLKHLRGIIFMFRIIFFSILKRTFSFPSCKIGLIRAQEDSRIVYGCTNTCCYEVEGN